MVLYSNILIIQTAFIGDAILASSVLETLHAQFPSAKLSILVRKGNESIYSNHPYLNEVLVWNKKEQKLKNLFSLLRRIRKNKYDCVINCHRFASSGLLTGFSGARHSAGYKQNPFSFLFNKTVRHSLSEGKHEVERYYELINDFVTVPLQEPKLYPSAHDYEFVKEFQLQPYICIAPASVWFTKQWPKEKWLELCAILPKNKPIYLLGAAGDTALCNAIVAEAKHTAITNLAGKLTLLQSAALQQKADMNYVNDSAPLHLASCMQAAVTAIFCSTVPEFGFGPRGKNAHIAQVKDLTCRPCGVHGHKACPLKHFDCAYKINLTTIS